MIRNLIQILSMVAIALVTVMAHAAPSVAGPQCAEIFEKKLAEYVPVTAPDGRTVIPSAVEIDGRIIYYESLPAAPGKPTALVFLGLFTPMVDLVEFQKEFAKQSDGEGLLIFTYSTQYESLYASSKLKPQTYAENLEIKMLDLIRQATAVVNAAGVHGPVTAVGYSYGSAPAARFAEFHKGRVTNLLFASPLVFPGEHAPELVATKQALEAMAMMTPIVGPAMVENMRKISAVKMADQIFNDKFSKGKIPKTVPREVLHRAFVAQIRAVEKFDLRQEYFHEWPKTHFLLAGNENASRLTAQHAVVRIVQANPAIAGRVISAQNGDHVIMADAPTEVASVILQILRTP